MKTLGGATDLRYLQKHAVESGVSDLSQTPCAEIAQGRKTICVSKKRGGTGMDDVESTLGRIRTCDLLIRSQLLYPAELRGRALIILRDWWVIRECIIGSFFRIALGLWSLAQF